MADISKITTLDGTTYDLKDAVARYYIPYGVCETAYSTAAKTVSIDGITEYVAGMAIAVKFKNQNGSGNVTLNINSLGAKPIYQYGTTNAGLGLDTGGWRDGAVVILVYDGTGWQFNKGYNTDTVKTITSVFCSSIATSSSKAGSGADYYSLRAGNIFEVTMAFSNTAASALTFNVNTTGAKPIYINGTASSTTNYTLPAGKYIVYYDGTNYHFRTDGKAPISISGDSATVNGHTVAKDVPSNAVFTDTTYTANTSKLVTTTVPNVTSVGSAPTLGTAIPADDITAWDAGSTPTLGTAIPADDITAWDAGSTPTLGTDIPADDITAWTTNTPTAVSVSSGVLTLTSGSAASLSYTAKSIPNVTSVGSVPSLSYTAKSIPNVTSVGSVPSLSYTAKSIPNVTSVGSAPTLGTAITVATGSLSGSGGGATVATGITAS